MVSFPRYEQYKDSGVEWLGEIPEHWNVSKLKYIIDKIESGKREQTSRKDILSIGGEHLQNGKLVLTNKKYVSKSFYQKLKKGRVKKHDILLVKDGATIGKSIYINEELKEPILINEHLYKIEASKFLYYYLISEKAQLYIWFSNNSSAQEGLNLSTIKNLVCPIPSLKEQNRIIEFLDRKTEKIDRAIAHKKRLIELLQEQKTILINQAVTKGLNPNAPMKDSGIEWLGKIPEHWKVVKLKHITKEIIDGAHLTPTYSNQGIPFLRVTDISNFDEEINLNTVKRIPEKEHIELCKRTKPSKGDILLSKNGTIGITTVVTWDFEFSFFVSLCLIKPKTILNPEYFCLFFNSPVVDKQINFGSKRTSVTNLHLDKIKELKFALPPIKEQKQIVVSVNNKFTPYRKLISKISEQIDKLTELKQILIAEAVTGKIKI